ncbi:tripartite tricarboxylate transporter TctB family protein [Jiella mangrovi]|uniref:Tripartite tricarboxylate transporter TctB family protein n=1 Tax=Jiella mangrovi TaxID=2821407 RepID=A0ABS4BN55_9HYPH|nr:tripartite tricarboxylate transporter TctB family protein [Jiella mangrovi]MBP0618177.1 tripartite tricarboxylate transporter TctB family protein [Jiella mangrovi]
MADRVETAKGRAMKLHDPSGTLVAVGFVAFGALLISSTGTMSPLGSVFPITISVAMIVFSLILIARNLFIGMRQAQAADMPEAGAGAEAETPGSMARRIAFLILIAAWVALIPVLGFFVASVLGFFSIMAVATHERLPAKEIVVLLVIGLAILTGFYLLMADVLLIPMPRGLFF